MNRSLAIALLTAAAAAPMSAADQALNLPIGDPARKGREMPLVLDGITDAARGDVVTPAEVAGRLDGVDILFVGESHTNIDFHRAQLHVIQELQRRGRRVVIGLEMYPASAQPMLDRWTADPSLTEEAFLAESHWYRSWGYHWHYYREIFAFARKSAIRLVGVNVPRDLVQTVRRKGLEGLSAEQRALLPERVDTDSAEHQQLFRAFFGDEDSLHGSMPEEMFEGMFRAQCTWDAVMGWNAIRARRSAAGEKAIVIVLIGSGHVAYGLGAERQARLWFDGRMASLVPIPVADQEDPQPITSVRASYADFVWGLPPETDPLYPVLGLATPEQKSGDHYRVIMVTPESVAAAAGFEVGDELLSIDGVPLDEQETSRKIMAEKRWGDTAVYKVLREGKEVILTAYFRRRPPAPPADEEPDEVDSPLGVVP